MSVNTEHVPSQQGDPTIQNIPNSLFKAYNNDVPLINRRGSTDKDPAGGGVRVVIRKISKTRDTSNARSTHNAIDPQYLE